MKLVSLDNLKYFSGKVNEKLDTKVDKVEGYGLSKNDFTDELKSKVDGIAEGAQVNVIETVKVNGEALTVTDKAVDVTVPTKLSDLAEDDTHKVATAEQLAQIATNKSDLDVLKADGGDGSIKKAISDAINTFATEISEDGTINTYKEVIDWIATHGAEFAALVGEVDKKVDKIAGKDLSTEDFTSEFKSKLEGIEAGAQVNTVTGIKGDNEINYRVGDVNITKANIGLADVENKSSETIRGELTSDNVTTALGFTPLNAADFTKATAEKDGLMSKEDFSKLASIEIPTEAEMKAAIDEMFA